MTILVAVGGNLVSATGSHPLQTCKSAAEALRSLSGLRVQAISHWYCSAPIPASDQPDYVNGMVRLEHEAAGDTDPAWLLRALQRIELASGRVRGAANAARTLDLDLIDVDGILRDSPDPILPHPRAHERAFVLAPLRDVAPGWRHPRLQSTVEDLLRGVADQALSRA